MVTVENILDNINPSDNEDILGLRENTGDLEMVQDEQHNPTRADAAGQILQSSNTVVDIINRKVLATLEKKEDLFIHNGSAIVGNNTNEKEKNNNALPMQFTPATPAQFLTNDETLEAPNTPFLVDSHPINLAESYDDKKQFDTSDTSAVLPSMIPCPSINLFQPSFLSTLFIDFPCIPLDRTPKGIKKVTSTHQSKKCTASHSGQHVQVRARTSSGTLPPVASNHLMEGQNIVEKQMFVAINLEDQTIVVVKDTSYDNNPKFVKITVVIDRKGVRLPYDFLVKKYNQSKTHPKHDCVPYVDEMHLLPNVLRYLCPDFIEEVFHDGGSGTPHKTGSSQGEINWEKDFGCSHMPVKKGKKHKTEPMHILYLLMKRGRRASEFRERFLFGGGYDKEGNQVVRLDYHPTDESEVFVRLCFKYTTDGVVTPGHFVQFFLFDICTRLPLYGYFRFSINAMTNCVYRCSSRCVV